MPMRLSLSTRWLAGLATALTLAGCDVQPPPRQSTDRQQIFTPPAEQQGSRQRHAAFLNRIREADPNGRTIDRALLNEQNELGLVLDRSVEMDKIPALMRVMLTKMASEFPGEDLTVLAYTPSNPPRKIGTARLNSRTRDTTYTAEK